MEKVILLNLGFTKIYLLRTDSGYIQFDAGYKHDMKKYLRLLEDNHILPEEIKLIVINHAHFDHTGALKDIQELTNAKVLCHENEKEFLVKGISAEVKPRTFLTKLMVPLMPKSWARTDPIVPDIVIQDEYSLTEFGVKAKVIHTPGHTPGTIAIITEDGDAIVGCNLHGPPLRFRLGFPTIYLDEDDLWKSWERIIKEGAQTLYISHGKPLKVDFLKRKLAKRKAQNIV